MSHLKTCNKPFHSFPIIKANIRHQVASEGFKKRTNSAAETAVVSAPVSIAIRIAR